MGGYIAPCAQKLEVQPWWIRLHIERENWRELLRPWWEHPERIAPDAPVTISDRTIED